MFELDPDPTEVVEVPSAAVQRVSQRFKESNGFIDALMEEDDAVRLAVSEGVLDDPACDAPAFKSAVEKVLALCG